MTNPKEREEKCCCERGKGIYQEMIMTGYCPIHHLPPQKEERCTHGVHGRDCYKCFPQSEEWESRFLEGIPLRGLHPSAGDFDENNQGGHRKFGYKVLKDSEIFTVVDWGNIKKFIQKEIESAYKKGYVKGIQDTTGTHISEENWKEESRGTKK